MFSLIYVENRLEYAKSVSKPYWIETWAFVAGLECHYTRVIKNN